MKKHLKKIIILSIISGILLLILSMGFPGARIDKPTPSSCSDSIHCIPRAMTCLSPERGFPFNFSDCDRVSTLPLFLDFGIYFAGSFLLFSLYFTVKDSSKKK